MNRTTGVKVREWYREEGWQRRPEATEWRWVSRTFTPRHSRSVPRSLRSLTPYRFAPRNEVSGRNRETKSRSGEWVWSGEKRRLWTLEANINPRSSSFFTLFALRVFASHSYTLRACSFGSLALAYMIQIYFIYLMFLYLSSRNKVKWGGADITWGHTESYSLVFSLSLLILISEVISAPVKYTSYASSITYSYFHSLCFLTGIWWVFFTWSEIMLGWLRLSRYFICYTVNQSLSSPLILWLHRVAAATKRSAGAVELPQKRLRSEWKVKPYGRNEVIENYHLLIIFLIYFTILFVITISYMIILYLFNNIISDLFLLLFLLLFLYLEIRDYIISTLYEFLIYYLFPLVAINSAHVR